MWSSEWAVVASDWCGRVRTAGYARFVSAAPTIPHAGLLHELLAIVELGPVEASTVAVELGRDASEVRGLLDEQVRRGRMKASRGPVRYELTPEGRLDLSKERLVYAILAEFTLGDAVSIAGTRDSVAGELGLTRRDIGEAATSLLTQRWIAEARWSGDYLEATAAGRSNWARAEARWPIFVAPLLARRRRAA